MRAEETLKKVGEQLGKTTTELESARKRSSEAVDKFNKIKIERTKKFITAFKVISDNIDAIYKDLTRNRGSRAYLTLENLEEPYSEGIKHNAIPPQKTFRDMEQLSGGEKTLAALALLFAIHSYQPSPFFVLDEVDTD